jgi:hypothetical protein
MGHRYIETILLRCTATDLCVALEARKPSVDLPYMKELQTADSPESLEKCSTV